MKRTKAREYAFILLFEYKFQPDEIEEILEDFIKEFKPSDQEEYIRNVVCCFLKNRDVIDSMINDASVEWSMERISAVNLSVLRLAVCEMLFLDDIPSMVSLNEAISIGKIYSGEENASYLNGVLSNIMHKIEENKNA